MNLLDYMEAYGTSEGANKGWDSRGRGRAAKNFEPASSTVTKDDKEEHKFFSPFGPGTNVAVNKIRDAVRKKKSSPFDNLELVDNGNKVRWHQGK